MKEVCIIMEPVKVAIIGCGTIANSAHIPAYMANKDAQIKYFCDIIPWKAQRFVDQSRAFGKVWLLDSNQ